ncbi:A-kinase anchor protein 9 [Onychostoma macrolepis]|uniref:A-kinase anchor protein 9 n=1 Tax=Onychostoma macrolepis TaxID=369639 RepID=UPI0027297C35|nr:A-kinase anchor protein 9 [Onychostoma macrolepis]
MMEDEERQRKLQAGKAKLAEYRQKKAQSDGQKKQKKKKKKPESDVEEQGRNEGEEQGGDQTTVFSLSKTLRSGETVTHDQTYTIEPESEVSTTAEDCSSEVNGFHERTESDLTASVIGEEDLQPSEAHLEPQSRIQIMEDELAAKNMAMEELSRELEEIRAAFGAEGVQQLQDFEEALKQRDEIITQLTANLQQARTEKEEVMREFLELTEQSQRLQIQFQQLQAGEILRSSNISSNAADLLQARQQITLYQQQLDERDAQVRGHQEKRQEQLLLIAQLQESLSEAERVRTQAEESFTLSLREKDLLNTEHQRLITQLQDQLLTSKQQVEEANKHLSAKTQELDNCEKELSASRQKERMSSGEILQLMKTVEDLQQRCHQGGQSESETLRRIEDDWSRRMEQLRAELDEMYGQQIVQMKQRIRAQHGSETEKIVQQHQSELERFKAQLFQSTGGVNVLNVKVIELQQKLQETQVLREKAEQEQTQTRAEKLGLAQEVERLRKELQRAEIQSPEKMQQAISDLQAQLDLAHEANGELEAKHESEITNYKIKLEMLEREKDAVLDLMAESQESELERLRTQLLFSHEEELSRLRDGLQRESQLNVENLRNEMGVRHREALDDFEDKLRSVESERSALASERLALLEEIVALKDDLNRAMESEELVAQPKELQAEVERLRAESEEKQSHPTERENLLQKINHLSSENEEICTRLKDLQDEIEKQRNTFSFAEKNFEVNYQELKDEYTCLVNAKLQLEERLLREAMEHETKLRDLQTRHEEVDGKTLMEKDTTELMEKLETAENEKKSLTERLSLMEVDVKRLEEELKKTSTEKVTSELMEKLETAENENRKLVERLSLMELETLKRGRDEALGSDRSVAGGLCSVEKHHAQISSSREELDALRSSPSSPTAAQERRERETPARTSHTHTAAHEEQLSASDRLPPQVETAGAQADGDAVRASLMMQPREMHGAEHEECRLQLEAQRISLSQIHAAQLELLRESLSAQTRRENGHPTELKAEFEECLERLEERQRQEIERLKSYYQQQMEETQERFTAEILLLQRRLQELTGAGEVFSMPSVCPPLTRDEGCERLQEEDEEERLRDPSPPEEPCLGRLEEEIAKVIVQMSVEFAQQTEQARISKQARETSTGIQTDNSEDEEHRLNSVSLMKSPEEEQTFITEHRTGEEEDEEFRDEREIPSEAFSEELKDTEIPAADDDDEEDLRSEFRSSHTLQLENTLLTAQTHTLSQQLLQTELELQRMKEREDETERRRDEHLLPSMQSCSTQTEQTSEEEEEEEEEEVTKGRGQGRAVTSDPELSSDVFTTERDALREANARLRLVLNEVLKTTAAAEETIGRHVEGILEASSKGHLRSVKASDASSESFLSRETAADDGSLFSAEAESDEGLELSLKIQGAELPPEREEFLMSISTRLQSAVEKLLIAITETSTQLEHARITQTELMREKFRHNEEMEELQRRQEELQERLGEEARAREQLALELHKAEGLIDGYTGERLALEQQIHERAELQLHLEQELCVTASRLRELEQERQQVHHERELMSRQQDAMREGAGPRELRLVEAALDAAPEADLLEETEKLMAEKVEVQRQAQKESGELLQQVKQLEAELEEQVSRLQELQEMHGAETADLRQQIQALEKQLENNRKFMDEQAADREHERDVFQLEIHNLEQQLKNPTKTQTGGDRRDREVQELSAALQEKADWCSELLLSSEQLQRDVCERDEEIETLGARLRELEHTLMHRVEEVQHVSMAGRADVTLEAQLQTEREALDRKEKEIVNLEEQLEQFREELENKSEEVNQLHMQLEIQRKEISSHQQDLQAQARLAQVLEEKDRQIAVLNEQLAKRQHAGTDPEKEAVEEKDELLGELEAQVECLRSEQQRLKRNSEEEVEQLNAVIEKLQQELALIEHKQPQDEYDEMKQRMEEALREKTATLVVLQAQVQALEESAGSQVMSLSRRVEELETSVEERDSELRACRLKVEQVQTEADALCAKVAQLEDNLREKVAAVLVSQAQLEAIQTQTKELRAEAHAGEAMGPSVQLRSQGLTAQDGASTGKRSLLTEKLKELEEGLSGMQKDQELQKQLLSSSEEEVMEYERRLAVMIDLLNQMRTRPTHHRPPPPPPAEPSSVFESGEGGQSLSELLQEVKGQAASAKEELNCYRELSHKLQEEIEMKESTITQLQTALTQVSSSAREEDAAETARLLQELREVRGQASSTQQELESCRGQSVRLQELLQEREMSIALLKDQLHRASQEGDQSTAELLQELQEVKGEAAATREDLRSFREHNLKLQEEIEVRDVSIAELMHKVQELQTALAKSSEEPLSQPKKKGEHHGTDRSTRKAQPSVPRRSSTEQCVSVCVQTEPSGAQELQEMVFAGYEEKIAQMQELHAAEILDMEARHISESETLRRENQQLEHECAVLRDAIHTLLSSQAPSVRSERPAVSLFKDGYTSDSGSDWSQRAGYDPPHLQQENRSTPEGAHRDTEPELLPDRIKSLLHEVHQEGMQVLSLSELPLSEADQPPQSWSKERDAFINTVESLKLLISRLQTHTQEDGDWRAELLSAVQQVFVQERDVLKNVLYSHLERLDTADAVIHLNQLERALAEQDARHRELMAALLSADRNSLRSEIQQLRDQLHSLTAEQTQRHRQDSAGTESERPPVESGSDRLEEMKTELNQTKLELESALQSQHKHLKELDTLRAEVSLKAAEVDTLNDRLAHEQKRARELQWAFEKEKCKSDRKEETEREEVEDLKLSLEELSSALEKERRVSARLREQELSVSELQVQLEAQSARSVELSGALEKQKELNTQLLQRFQTSSTSNPQPESETHTSLMQAEASCSQVEAGVLSVEALLQTQLAEKQTQVVQMMEELERHKLEALQRKQQWDKEKSAAAQDQNALRATRDGLERRASELQTELERERDGVRRLERDRDRLQETLRQLEDHNQSTRSDTRPEDRTRDWVLQTGDAQTLESNTASLREGQRSDPKHMDSILSRLQLIAAKINSLTSESPDRLSGQAPDRDSLAWLQSNVQDVMSLLQHIPSAPSGLPESTTLLVGGSSSLLNERLLRQNAELTGFVSRLTEEKNDLRNQLLKLEEELRRYRQKKTSTESSWIRAGGERQELVVFSSERDSWAQERNRLEKSLRQAEAELTRLRAEIRSETLRDLTGADLDNAALRRMYGKYLRAESFRKALIYQKKYLLLLLGGFQECEEATLSLIARMGGFPAHTCLESVSHQRRGFTRFRSAVRVSIALSRMRFLVKRWQRAAGGSVTSQIVNRNGLAQITGADVRNESSYLHPGGVEAFRERRTTSRGRTGRDSPRSAASLQHRFHSMAGDGGGLQCSHLQNYDPDRALTDYISRLEALQRRLGSVQSGSSSYAQLHFGVRR